jgi:hypothetical protein
MLSPRVLRFSSHYLRWTCKFSRVDCRHSDICTRWSSILYDNLGRPRERMRGWLNIVEAYCKRQMSNPGDKLLAISAIAQDYHQQFTGINKATEYLAGTWKHQLPLALMWLSSSKSLPPRPLIYRAPSWSWASIH